MAAALQFILALSPPSAEAISHPARCPNSSSSNSKFPEARDLAKYAAALLLCSTALLGPSVSNSSSVTGTSNALL